MIRFFKSLSLAVAAWIVATMAWTPSVARADFELRYSTDGGATFTTTTSSGGPLSLTVDGLNIAAVSTSSSSTAFSAIDLALSGMPPSGPVNVIIEATRTSLLTAPQPFTLRYTFGEAFGPPGGISSQIWIDQSNQDFGGATGGPGGTNIVADTGPHTAVSSGSLQFNAVPPYSATLETNISFTSNGTNVLSQDSGFTITPTPAPPSFVLLASTAPVGLGLFWLRRRRTGKSKRLAIA
ncbi:MAG TPA: hypothetical protein VKS79_06685 [Gemmataceae bacterium]|nr:hypothetical protein [Gemmataceae bacterium]